MKTKKTSPKSKIINGHTGGYSSILSALKKDHDDLRSMIDVLKSEADVSKKKALYSDFTELLKSHAKTEEKAVYEMALKIKDLKAPTFEAYEEHAVAETLMKKIKKTKNQDQWIGRVKVLAEVVEHHIKEEENEYLLDVKKKLKGEQEIDMVEKFLKKRIKAKHQPSDKHNGVLKTVEFVS